jgi:Amidohydrolase family
VDRSVSRRQFLRGVSVIAAGAVLDACSPATSSLAPMLTEKSVPTPSRQRGGLVLRNANVLTMDPAHPEADAVAISGDTITFVGSEADALAAAPTATIVDVGGRVLLPGFNDAHCHRIGDRREAGYDSAEAAIDAALAGGWTSITEMFVDEHRLNELRALDEAGTLRVRVNAYLPVNYLEQKFGVWFGDYRPHQVISPRVRIGGVKLFADSAWSAKMYMTDPHMDQPGYRGEVYWAPDELTDLVRTLHDDGWQIATHTAGDAGHDLVLDAYAAALAGSDDLRHRHRIMGGAFWDGSRAADTIRIWVVDIEDELLLIEGMTHEDSRVPDVVAGFTQSSSEHKPVGPAVGTEITRIVESMRFD